MINKRVEIQPFGFRFTDGQEGLTTLSVSDVALNPFYASIHDIELAMPVDAVEFSEEFSLKVAEFIFNKSIWIELYLKRKHIKLSEEEMYAIKRDYVICAVLAQIGTILYGAILKGQSVKKVLGDFEVDRSSDFDTDNALKFAKDAEDCVKEIISALDEMAKLMAQSFSLGSWNCNNRHADRLWHHPKFLSRMPIAANKLKWYDGKYYKTGYGHGNEHIPLHTRG